MPKDLYPAFTRFMTDAGYAPSTIYTYQRVVRRWQGSGRTPTAWLAAEQEKSRQKHGAPTTTVQRHRDALALWHRFKGQAVDLSIPRVLRRAKPRPGHALTPQQEHQVVRALAAPDLREPQASVVRLLHATGLRVGAATLLTMTDIQTDSGLAVHVRAEIAKNRKARVVPLNTHAAGQLHRYLQTWRAARPSTPWLFPSPHGQGRRPITTRAVRQFCDDLGAAAQIPRLHPHAFRHTLGTRLLEAGVAPELISAILGHTMAGSAATATATYLHPGVPTLRAALGRLRD